MKTFLRLFALCASLTLPAIAADTIDPVTTGTVVTLEANADGDQPLMYQWLRDGVAIAGSTAKTIQVKDAARYTVKVTNDFGTLTGTDGYVLKVGVPPSGIIIKRVLTNQTLKKQARLEWGIEATGDELTFRWQQGTSLLTGVTGPTLVIPRVNPSHSGIYKVTVRNKSGEEVSSQATLKVL